MTNDGTLSIQTAGKIATIAFGHPASNSFPAALLRRLANELQLLGEDVDVAVIVLKSEGSKAFCAGASFDELLAVKNAEQGAEFFSGFANVINAMRKCPKLIVGRIHGKVVGGGVGLAAACDYALAATSASVKLSELAIGIGPFVIAPAVERKVGKTGLAELTLAPDQWKSSSWALQKGLYAKVFESVEELDADLSGFCNSLASYNPEALSELKKILWEGTENWDELLLERAAVSGKLVLSDFTKNALEAFKK